MIVSPLESLNIFNIVRLFVIATTAFFLNLIVTYFWTKVLFTDLSRAKPLSVRYADIQRASS